MNENYSHARTIAGVLIQRREEALTVDMIRACVDQACFHITLNGEDRERLVRDLETVHQTVIGEERQLVDDSDGWRVWLPDRKAEIEGRYWQRYEEYLGMGPMSPRVRLRLDSSTDRVLGLLGDPQREGAWDRRGLVVGLVQSGKTSHYIGLINKAIDAGYKVVVVLTGFTESLRVQTQIRAEEGIIGHFKHRNDNYHICGVGKISPEPRPDSVTTRGDDFKKTIAKNFGIGVGGTEIIFVIKKNVGILGHLLRWVESFGRSTDANGNRFVKGVPLLVIDDESDVGSIDTKKGNIVDDDPDPDHEPSRTNRQIRRLLSLFDQSSYVGYTATPFANVLIHEGARTDELGEDLFPRSFIVSLPTPSDHVGPSMIFGSGTDGDGQTTGLPIVRTIPSGESQGEEAWIPPVHKKTHFPLYKGRDDVPPSLRQAILAFILVVSVRRLRKAGPKHNSMLVHVTRFNDVQQRVEEQIRKELKGIGDRLQYRVGVDDLLGELQDLWESDFCVTTRRIASRDGAIFNNPEHRWEDVCSELLPAVSSIQIRTINGLALEVLDYETHKDGLSVIAVGGDKLSRGLTLEGLSVSYFLRCSRMYDTLMQMGRWFGYRPGYLDLCRLYTTDELSSWFGHIATATEELRAEFDLMANSGGTPKDFGLKVRCHPQLMVTSQVKMRHGQRIQVTFQGDIIETINFRRDPDSVKCNWHAAERLMQNIESGAGTQSTDRRKRIYWSKVPSDCVTQFLEDYIGHDSALKARPKLLREYIEKEVRKKRLTEWSVIVSGGKATEDPRFLGSQAFHLVQREWYPGRHIEQSTEDFQIKLEELKKRNEYCIRRLVNPPDETVDLDDASVKLALEKTKEDFWNGLTRHDSEPVDPSGKHLRDRRLPTNGLLIIYPLRPDEGKSVNEDTPIIGFAISFPTVDDASATKVTYTVNNVYQKQELEYQ